MTHAQARRAAARARFFRERDAAAQRQRFWNPRTAERCGIEPAAYQRAFDRAHFARTP